MNNENYNYRGEFTEDEKLENLREKSLGELRE